MAVTKLFSLENGAFLSEKEGIEREIGHLIKRACPLMLLQFFLLVRVFEFESIICQIGSISQDAEQESMMKPLTIDWTAQF